MKAGLLIAAAVILAAPMAYADDVTALVRGIDTGQHQIGLDTGKVYAVSPEVPLANLKPGDKVTVSFTVADAVMAAQGIAGVVTKISPAK